MRRALNEPLGKHAPWEPRPASQTVSFCGLAQDLQRLNRMLSQANVNINLFIGRGKFRTSSELTERAGGGMWKPTLVNMLQTAQLGQFISHL